MKPASGKSLIGRVVGWSRGMWASSGDRRLARQEKADASQRVAPAGPAAGTTGTQDDDVAANGSPESGAGAATGASQDEFASGGYTPDSPDLEDVESAAEGGDAANGDPANRENEDDSRASALVDQEMSEPHPPSGNYGVGNLGLGSRGSLGATPRATAPPDDDPGQDDDSIIDQDTIDVAEAAVPDDTAARQPGLVEAGDTERPIPDTGANVADPDVPASAEENVRGIDEAGDDELGRLDELDQEAIAFESDADERYDENSQPRFAADVPDSLAEIDYETDDYSSSTLQDAGLRIVDEDEAGVSVREPADDEFVDPGSVIDVPAQDTSDARPLGDFTQERSGIASESDEPTATAGDRSDAPFGSETGMATAETWTDEESTEGLGTAGELAATDFGSTVGGEASGGDDESVGLVTESDIDVADLSYLDASEQARFAFTETSAATNGGDEAVPASAGPVDDIGASSTGVSDAGGDVQSDLGPPGDPPTSSGGNSESVRGTGNEVADDIADSPTGVVDVGTTTHVLDEDGAGGAREHVPLASSGAATTATGTDRPDATGPGGSVRGDGTGGCPADYPIKGNSSSKIYHLPAAASYAGTKAEWCFAGEEQAQAAGYRPPGQRNRGGGSPGPTAGSGSGRRGSGGRGR